MVGRDRRARRKRASSKKGIAHQIQTPPVALTVAGSDSSAGAGIQADLKTFSALGVYGVTAVTCIVAEIPGMVSRIEAVSATMVREQIEVLLRDFEIRAIKTGLLCSAEIVSAVADTMRAGSKDIVIDPVMIATSGDCLLHASAIDAYKNELFPLATLITPNLNEAGLLLDTTIKNRQQMEQAAKALAKRYRGAILLKGGHLQGDQAVDLLFDRGRVTEFAAPFVRGIATHGTGCTYSAAITAGLASGLSLEKAIGRAKKFVTGSIARHFRWKSPSGKTVDALSQHDLNS
jgi:hydroxymethylpyrimidine/phosphomethylpyrimidine kinase